MGLPVDVIAAANARTYPRALVLVAALGKPVSGPFEPGEDDAVMIVAKEHSFGTGLQAVRAVFDGRVNGRWVPRREAGAGPMFNGRFVWSGDSRFGEALGESPFARPVKLFDRWEQ